MPSGRSHNRTTTFFSSFLVLDVVLNHLPVAIKDSCNLLELNSELFVLFGLLVELESEKLLLVVLVGYFFFKVGYEKILV